MASNSSFTYLITGASRGLGFAYSKALLASSPSIRIVATARNPDKAEQLKALAAEKENEGRVLVVKLDVSDEAAVAAFGEKLANNPFVVDGIDALVNNAGIALSFKSVLETDTSELEQVLRTNLFGVIWVTKAVLPLLRTGKGKQIINISSVGGSLSHPYALGTQIAAYTISKAALNMATVKLAAELKPEGFTVVPFHPGWVRTEINPPGVGDLEVDEAVELALKNLFTAITPEDNGRFISFDGTTMGW